jgi:putative zinc finger/helix-turn-helix YgiT family protein
MEKNYLCPQCNKELKIQKRIKQEEFRKEVYEITEHYYYCEECKKESEPDFLIELNMNQLYNQYREKHNILFPEQIKKIREEYKLNPIKISRILGFGDNVYRSYENGEVPSISNARILKMGADPEKFEEMVKESKETYGDEVLSKNEFDELNKIIKAKKEEASREKTLEEFILDKSNKETRFTGYKRFDILKFFNMVNYFLEFYGDNYKTYINKFLFYSDFLNYKSTGFSISGTEYIAIQKGPVPDWYDLFYDLMKHRGYIIIEEKEFINESEEKVVEKFISNKPFEKNLFSENELESLNKTLTFFKKLNPLRKIVDLSHEEKAWKDNVATKQKIDYQKYAFEISHL